MGKSISVESRVLRGVAALAIGVLATACAKEKAAACGNAEIYPEGDAALPVSGSYLVEVPQAKACAVEVFDDAYQTVYLEIYSGGVVDLIVFENTTNRYGVVFTSLTFFHKRGKRSCLKNIFYSNLPFRPLSCFIFFRSVRLSI